jgi:hypothetical protein
MISKMANRAWHVRSRSGVGIRERDKAEADCTLPDSIR